MIPDANENWGTGGYKGERFAELKESGILTTWGPQSCHTMSLGERLIIWNHLFSFLSRW